MAKKFSAKSAAIDTTQQSPYLRKTSPFSEGKLFSGSKKTVQGFDRILPHKTYQGREAALVRTQTEQLHQMLSASKDLPDRPLSIAEVRDLINRGSLKETTKRPTSQNPPSAPRANPVDGEHFDYDPLPTE